MIPGDGAGDEAAARRLRHLVAWHRVALALTAFTTGRWLPIAVAGAVFGALPPPEASLALVEVAVLAALWAGLYAYARMVPWSVPVLAVTLAACAFPWVRESVVEGSVRLDGADHALALPVTRLEAPSLSVSLPVGAEIIPLALAAWLLWLRGRHRSLALQHPDLTDGLRPRRVAWVAAAVLIALPAIPTALYLSALDVAAPVGADAAARRVEQSFPAGAIADVACVRASGLLEGPLFRPFYVVMFVASGRAEVEGRPVAGLRRVDASSGEVARTAVVDDTSDAAQPPTPEELCQDAGIDVTARTRTWAPWG